MNFVFIRHSKSLVNPNIPITTWGLSEEGVNLAKKLNELTQIRNLDVIYASLQPKALETAILATKNLGIQVKTDDRLTESTSFTNKFVSVEELEQNERKYFSGKDIRINNGETASEALNRFQSVLNAIANLEKGKENIGIVSHGNILATFSEQYREKKALQLVKEIKQPDIAIFTWDKKEFINFFGEIKI